MVPELSFPEPGPGPCGYPTPSLVAMTHGSTSAEWHCWGRMQIARRGSSCEPVGQLTFQGPKSLCVLDKLLIVVLALPSPSDSNKCSQTRKEEEIRNQR